MILYKILITLEKNATVEIAMGCMVWPMYLAFFVTFSALVTQMKCAEVGTPIQSITQHYYALVRYILF